MVIKAVEERILECIEGTKNITYINAKRKYFVLCK